MLAKTAVAMVTHYKLTIVGMVTISISTVYVVNWVL